MNGKRLYMSYDHEGFKSAMDHGTDEDFDSTHSLSEIFEQLLSSANHDWFHGLCESYQIYNEKGEVIYNRSKELSA